MKLGVLCIVFSEKITLFYFFKKKRKAQKAEIINVTKVTSVGGLLWDLLLLCPLLANFSSVTHFSQAYNAWYKISVVLLL